MLCNLPLFFRNGIEKPFDGLIPTSTGKPPIKNHLSAKGRLVFCSCGFPGRSICIEPLVLYKSIQNRIIALNQSGNSIGTREESMKT